MLVFNGNIWMAVVFGITFHQIKDPVFKGLPITNHVTFFRVSAVNPIVNRCNFHSNCYPIGRAFCSKSFTNMRDLMSIV